jgi:abortive infection bacteriophage resistance protein
MKYAKPALTYEQQADLLLSRGLQADRDTLITRLQAVNYYRLSGFLYPFRNPDDTFKPGTTLDIVWRRYTFDRRLRLIVLDAIERVEVAVRSQIVYEHVHRYGPFGYTVPVNLPKLDGNRFGQFLTRVYEETQRSHEVFVQHFQGKYGDQHGYLPLWMASEIMPYGAMFALFAGVEPNIKRVIAHTFGIPDAVMFSWLNVLNMVRNICAHHGRLWNRELGVKPLMPSARKYPQWHSPTAIPNHRVFAVLTILKHMSSVAAPQSRWPERVRTLLAEYPDIPRPSMGFPSDWEKCPIWQ